VNNNSEERSENTHSISDLLSIIQGLQKELVSQRTELVSQRQELEQLRQTTKSVSNSLTVVPDKTTTRRRMLRRLVAGAAGAAALGTATIISAPAALAGTFDFNGAGSAGTNVSTANTLITYPSGSATFPLLTINNNSSASGSGSNPDNLSIGLLAKSNNSFGLYGWNTSTGGTAPSGVIGVSGNNGVLSDPFFTNSNGGVVGTSSTNPGTMGLSQTNSGVEGRSITGYGVKGIASTSGIGGAFGNDSADPNVGAPLRLALRSSSTAPTSTGSNRDAGEVVLDIAGRVYVCQAGYRLGGVPAPAFTFTNPGFPGGMINTNGANWRFMAPMVIKSGPPQIYPITFTADTDLHVQGELWLDQNTGRVYINNRTGSTNTSMLTNVGLTGSLPAFLPISRQVTFFATPSRFIDTRPLPTGINDPNNPYANGTSRTYKFSGTGGLVGRGGATVPAEATAIVGNATVVANSPGYLQISPNGLTGNDPSSLNFNASTATNNLFFIALNGNGQATIQTALYAGGTSTATVIIDLVGYIS
jgi:hypothetical protein